MKKDLNEWKQLKNQMLAIGVAISVAASLTGCKQKGTDASQNTGLLLEETGDYLKDSEAGLYTYILNTNGFASEKYDFSGAWNNIRLARVV